jgi:2'-5' RNA ligase
VRLFVAIVPPPSALAELGAAVDQLRARADSQPLPVNQQLRWTSSEQWHLTLAFLGEVDDVVVAKLRPRLERAAARHPAQRLAIAGGGAFPSARNARILWAGLRADNRALSGLAGSVAAAARRAGAPSPDEDRRFKGHLTLARCRDAADLSHLTTALADFAGQEWTADSVRLVRSYLSAGPSRYETAGAWPLLAEPRR